MLGGNGAGATGQRYSGGGGGSSFANQSIVSNVTFLGSGLIVIKPIWLKETLIVYF